VGGGKKSQPNTRSCSADTADACVHVKGQPDDTLYFLFFLTIPFIPQMKLAEKQPTFMKHLKPTDPSA
jgi:hypothetical protein